jgi:hypothetical protein
MSEEKKVTGQIFRAIPCPYDAQTSCDPGLKAEERCKRCPKKKLYDMKHPEANTIPV